MHRSAVGYKLTRVSDYHKHINIEDGSTAVLLHVGTNGVTSQ